MALRRHAERRARVDRAREDAGVRAPDRACRIGQAAALRPTQAACWVGVDSELVRHDDRQVWEAVKGPLERFRRVVRSKVTKAREGATAGEWDETLAGMVSTVELNALACVDPELTLSINEARARVDDALRQRLRRLRTSVAEVRAACDPHTRAEHRRTVEPELVSDIVRDALSRREWMRLARDAGLGRVDSVEPRVRASNQGA